MIQRRRWPDPFAKGKVRDDSIDHGPTDISDLPRPRMGGEMVALAQRKPEAPERKYGW